MSGKKGTKLVYKTKPNPPPKGAVVITANFSMGRCQTLCPFGETPKVGSVGCTGCTNYMGQREYGINTGNNGKFGSTTNTHEIYCKGK